MIKRKDITGKLFGNLTVLGFSHYNKYKVQYWNCKCSCGNIITVRKSYLLSGEKTHCGCKDINNLCGKRFGRLTVIDLHHLGNANVHYWLCRCDCGKETVVRASCLLGGNTRSCGCLRIERTGESHLTHGICKKNKRLYKCWVAMLDRCENQKNASYKEYGGRGIKVCKEWHNVKSFYTWAINNGYKDTLTLDRIDNNGDYCPENCRWATRLEQSHNTRTNLNFTINGKTMCLSELCRHFKVCPSTIRNKLNKGFTIERALGIKNV